jgi:hypothetical protein
MLCIPNRSFYGMFNFAQRILEPGEIFCNIIRNAELRIRSKFIHHITKVSHYLIFNLIFVLIPSIRTRWIISETPHSTQLCFIFVLARGLRAIWTA